MTPNQLSYIGHGSALFLRSSLLVSEILVLVIIILSYFLDLSWIRTLFHFLLVLYLHHRLGCFPSLPVGTCFLVPCHQTPLGSLSDCFLISHWYYFHQNTFDILDGILLMPTDYLPNFLSLFFKFKNPLLYSSSSSNSPI